MPCYRTVFTDDILMAAPCGLLLCLMSLKTSFYPALKPFLWFLSVSFLNLSIFSEGHPNLQNATIEDMAKIISLLCHIASSCPLSHDICSILPEEYVWNLGLLSAQIVQFFSKVPAFLLHFFYCSACLPSSNLWNKSKISRVSGNACHSVLK